MLANVPMVLTWSGSLPTPLSGADFGAGLWTLLPGGGRAGAAVTGITPGTLSGRSGRRTTSG